MEHKLTVSLRNSDFGSAGSRRLVRAGMIPAVVYGKNAPVHVVVNAREWKRLIGSVTESTLIILDIDGEETEVLLKDVQENLLTDTFTHIDFYEVTRGQLLRTLVKVVLTGQAAGTRVGGVLDQVTHEVEIECFPRHLPEELTLDVSALNINESLAVSDIVVPETIKILTPADTTVASVKAVKAEEEPAAEETDDAAAATEESAN